LIRCAPARRDFIHGDTVVVNEPEQDEAGQDGHVTMTLSVIGAYLPGRLVGTAFGATFALGKTEDEASETPVEMDYWQAGAEWADSLGADVISSSLGYSTFDSLYSSYTYADMDGRTTVVTRRRGGAPRHRGGDRAGKRGCDTLALSHRSRRRRHGVRGGGHRLDGRGDVLLVVRPERRRPREAGRVRHGPRRGARVAGERLGHHPGERNLVFDAGLGGSLCSSPRSASELDALRVDPGARDREPLRHARHAVRVRPARAAARLGRRAPFSRTRFRVAPHSVLAGPTPTMRGGEIAFWARGHSEGPGARGDLSTRAAVACALCSTATCCPAPNAFLSWDGRDEEGRRAAAGVYFVRFDAPGVHLGRRVVLL
jgi:hypothetical protein